MGANGAVLLEFETSLDYCQPILPDHETTSEALDAIHEFGVRIEMRRSCWRNLTDSLTNTLELFLYLRDQASELLRQHDSDKALEIFNESVLTKGNLVGDQHISLSEEYMPDVEDLREAVEEMGIKDFRGYADTQQRVCSSAQDELDLMIDSYFDGSGKDPYLFEVSVEQVVDSDRIVDVLVDAHIWGTQCDGYLLTRHESVIHSEKEEILDCMAEDAFDILSPVEVAERLA
ncbi:hypothetical protein [Salinarchaeum laminariae]|uniref:hypothetical protein n=1 Tax=Salinarchaeum laminariae TaxID=869888 RepID=UPI0020BE7125|nr:hypothetical protein [Salinarchaeum laminariae]